MLKFLLFCEVDLGEEPRPFSSDAASEIHVVKVLEHAAAAFERAALLFPF